MPESESSQNIRPIRSENCALLVASIARGRRWLDEFITDPAANKTESITSREGCSVQVMTLSAISELQRCSSSNTGKGSSFQPKTSLNIFIQRGMDMSISSGVKKVPRKLLPSGRSFDSRGGIAGATGI